MVKRVIEDNFAKNQKKSTKQRLSVKKIQEKTKFPPKQVPNKITKSKKIDSSTKSISSIKKTIGETKFPSKKSKKTAKKNKVSPDIRTKLQGVNHVKKAVNKTQATQKIKKPLQGVKPKTPQKTPNSIKKIMSSKNKDKNRTKMLLQLVGDKITNNLNILKIIVICLIAIILILSLTLILRPKNKTSPENIVILNNSEKTIQEETKNIQEEIKTENLNQTDEIIQIEPEPPEEKIGQLKLFNLVVNTTKEEIILERNHKKLNLYEKIVDVFREDIRDNELPLFLNDSHRYSLGYSQEIILNDRLLLYDFQEDDYLEGQETTGFVITDDLNVFEYKIKFKEETEWEDLQYENIRIFGKNYEILSYSPEEKEITLLENPLHFNMNKKDIVTIKTLTESENISVYFMGNDEAILNISGKKTNKLSGGSELFTDKFYFYTKDVIGINQDPDGLISMIVSDKVVTLTDLVGQKLVGDTYELAVNINSTDEYINDITISWIPTKNLFLTSDSELYLPYFNTIKLYMSDEYDMDPDKETSHYYSNYWEVFLEAKSETFEWQLNQTELKTNQTDIE